MCRVLFVSLNTTYPQIAEGHRNYDSQALRNCTSMAWSVNVEASQDIDFVFGVVSGRIVSAYRVTVAPQHWPLIPESAEGAGRRIIPVSLLPSANHWASALALTGPDADRITMNGPIRYGDVLQAADGQFTAVHFEP